MSEKLEKPTAERPRKTSRSSGSRTGGSLFFPILLVVLGIIFLLRNIGALPGDIWQVILNLWPLILIVIGLDNLFSRQGVAAPTIFIAIGTVILLDNLNFVNWDIWRVILNLWPVLIVAIGLDLLIARRSTWGAILSLILIAFLLGGSLWIMASGSMAVSPAQSEKVEQTLNGAEKAAVEINPAVADLHVQAMAVSGTQASPDLLAKGSVQMGGIGSLQQEYNIAGDTGYFTLSWEGESFARPFLRNSDWVWDLSLNTDVPLELAVSMGAGSIDLDLSGIQISDLEVNAGVGRTVVVLPGGEGTLTARIQGAVGEMILIVPEQKAVQVTYNTGLAAISVPEGFVKDGEGYTYNPAGVNSPEWVYLNVDQAIGRISIQYP